MKKIALLLCIAAVLGCGLPYSLVFHNRTGEKVEVSVSYKEGDVYSGDLTLDRGQSYEYAAWRYGPPNYLRIKVKGSSVNLKREFLPPDYPPEMQKGSSGGHSIHVNLSPSGIELEGPVPFEEFQRNPFYYPLLNCCAFSIVIGAAVYFWRRHKLRKLASSKAYPKATVPVADLKKWSKLAASLRPLRISSASSALPFRTTRPIPTPRLPEADTRSC